jgi:hypothetical protein
VATQAAGSQLRQRGGTAKRSITHAADAIASAIAVSGRHQKLTWNCADPLVQVSVTCLTAK